ncbi:spore germination protein [Sutcliffiella horikoshii]|uniref:spore germination protein n=1 Tax=Sutcliffiella horikoshii TaxID=79883 RepID=UPI00204201BD|nr:spore germination protein [Sutcliffiella horikoshii]MCM3618369.1 spore germination protein [Sutcliffiella horikoshii]
MSIVDSEFSHVVDKLIADFSHTDDFTYREDQINTKRIFICYIASLTDPDKLFKRLSDLTEKMKQGINKPVEFLAVPDTSDIKENILEGQAAVIVEGCKEVILMDATLSVLRSNEEPGNERVIRGAHDGFIECLKSNINIIRNRIKDPKLSVKYFTIGHSTCALLYINDNKNSRLIKEIEEKLQLIKEKDLTTSGIVEEVLEEVPFSPFPQVLHTERPDRTASYLTEGKVALLFQGHPNSLIIPITFISFFQSPDDFSSRWLTGSFYRLLRTLSFFIAISLPALYIAIVSFHPEVIPKGLILLFKQSVEDVPYPPIVEAIIIEITLELLREAGIRLPSPIGQTIGIVGGLVIGDAVVNAGLVSNMMIIVVALTAISSFIVPTHEMSSAVRLIRFPLMITASTLGFVGIIYGLLIIFIHLCRLSSFGQAYFFPFAPFNKEHMKDSIVRLPFSTRKQKKDKSS